MKTHSEQEEWPVQVPDVMPNVAPPQERRRGRGRGRTPGQGSAPRRGVGKRMCKETFRATNCFTVVYGCSYT